MTLIQSLREDNVVFCAFILHLYDKKIDVSIFSISTAYSHALGLTGPWPKGRINIWRDIPAVLPRSFSDVLGPLHL
jgi:hypothetical protein